MDFKEDFGSSDESLGSEEEDAALNGHQGQGNQLPGSDSLLDSSDSGSDDDEGDNMDMEVDEEAAAEELKQINDQLASNPYSYDLYTEKIKILKKLGDLDKLRETREKFRELYPLAEQLWLEWLKDEVKLACTDEEKEGVVQLFEYAVKDYLSVDIWLEYINFVMSQMGTAENGQQKCRDIFERALGSVGLHVSMGSLVWDMYRDFEAAWIGTAATEDDQKAQENRYISLCRRQLSVPLLGMSSTYEDLQQKIDIDQNTETAYKKALEKLKTLEGWEAKLVQSSGQEKLQAYREYIEDEKKSKSNPARVQCLYERAVADNPLDSSLWLEYLEYLGKNLKIGKIILETANRAARNISWDISIWLKYINLVEIFAEDEEVLETMKSVFEKAIMYCATGEQAGTVWLKYLEFLRRKVDLSNGAEGNKEIEIIRKTFVAAEEHLLQLLVEPNDYLSEILLFRARFEAQLAKSMNEEVTNLWKEIINRGYGQFAKIWTQYILQEVMYGCDVRKIRSHYSKALSYVRDDPQTISALWINFERDNGDRNNLEQCESKISTQLAKKMSSAAVPPPASYYDRQNEGRANTGVERGKKRKLNDPGSDSTDVKKGRKKEDVVDGDGSENVFKVPSVPNAKVKSPQSKKDTEKETEKHGESVKHDPSKDNRTVFLSNLAFTTTEEEIRQFFEGVGEIEEIRLAKDFKGRSKGFGFVFFMKPEEAKTALGKDRQPINGRPAFVSKCDPDKTTRQKQFKYATNLEKNKLFVKGLPFTLTADELKDIFKAYGDLKDCRLVTYRNGHSKGLAYVEYHDEVCATQAILKADGMEIGDKKISVAISNPPPKRAGSSAEGLFQKSSTSSDNSQRRAPRAFVPRSLQLSGSKKESAGSTNSTTSNSAPKSNQEFRNMFLK